MLSALAAALPVAAWSDAGHRAVAAIAWEHLSPEARRQAVELLLAAPADSGIRELLPARGAPDERRRQLFLAAATWPDRIKRTGSPHDHSGWHYTNLFWREGKDGEPVPVPELRPAPQNVVERIGALSRGLADRGAPPAQRALDLAWLLHLVGDVHHPLHTAARVTARPGEERGDRGGNAFELHRERRGDERWNLHLYWDRILDLARPRRTGESRVEWIDRLASEAARAEGVEDFELHSMNPRTWASEGTHLAQTEVYRGVERLHEPSAEYRQRALHHSRTAIARAGYRLADLLEKCLGRRSTSDNNCNRSAREGC
jgi:hypothetical protein